MTKMTPPSADRASLDPKGLFREAYRMDGLDGAQCRSIFLDWALSTPVDLDTEAALSELLAHYGEAFPDHPMTQVLRDGLQGGARPKRRGGWRSRERAPFED
ncbi:hypothetical protein [Ruegeria sp. TM1040]|jgi:hypothetical protein|uniref:hypothetical protein n=1 Tax=Ruegeria sp. (strain TM1040) TaxID=292414 RepID=UPI00031521A7